MSGQVGRAEILKLVRSVKRRWRLRVALRGLSYVIALTAAATFLSSVALERLRFTPEALLWLRILTWGTLAASAWAFLLRPLARRLTDGQVALYLEEHEPSLEHAVVSALDADETRHPSPALARRVVETALERARRVDFGRRVEQPGLYRFGGLLTVVALAVLAMALAGPGHLRDGAGALLVPTRDAAAVNPFTIAVTPGDVTIPRHTDQLISAQLSGFDAAEASVFTRTSPDAPFQRMSMLTGDDGGFQLMLLGVDQRTQYFVEASGVRSHTYTIDVAELPYVDHMDLVYHFPAYTGLAPRTVQNGGDVAALPGTVVEVRITPTIPASEGRLLVDGAPADSLTERDNGTLVGRFTVRKKGFYSVDLARADGQMSNASPEYTIDLLDDQEPTVRFTKPGRDTQVSPIEEVYLEMRADDDYGIGDVRLVYSANGGPEDTIPVFQASGAPLPDVSTGHTLYMEELGLEPGDLVSYYAIARDNRGRSAKPVASDIYFLHIRPFERTYRQGQSGAGQGQGQGSGESNQALSEMERQIIAATFNLIRQKDTYQDDEFSQNVVSVGLAQERLRGQVGTLVQRMHERGLTDSDQGVHDVAAVLPRADSAMVRAKAHLDEEDLKKAIPEEQIALRYLQQAEDTYERVVVQQQSQGGGGGGGQQGQPADDLADLFQLQLDKLKNQYETVQRGQQQQSDDQVDALVEKLKELARRQQQEAERQRQQGQPGQQGQQGQSGSQSASGSAGGGNQQRSLADQTEQAARELERLARQNGDPELQETARRLQEAADAMRRAAARSGSAARAEANAAADRLEEARRRLEDAQSQRARRDAESAIRQTDDLIRQQRGVEDDVRNMPQSGQARADDIDRLRERKDQMNGAVSDLEKQLDRAATVSRGDQPEAAQKLADAANQIRDSKLKEKIQYSRGTIEQYDPGSALTFELGIENDMQTLREKLQDALNSASAESKPDPLKQALENTRDLMRSMESMDRRLRESGAPGQGEQQSQRGQAGDQQGQAHQQGQAGNQQGQTDQQNRAGNQQGQAGQQGRAGNQQGQAGQQGRAGNQQGQAGDQQGGRQGGQQGDRAGARQGGRPGQSGTPPTGNMGGSRDAQPGSGGRLRPLTADDIGQITRELRERALQADSLSRQLRAAGQDATDARAIRDAIQRLQQRGVWSDPAQAAAMQAEVLEALKRLEFSLRREVEGAPEQRATLQGSDEVPDAYRKLVERYYKALAGSGGSGRSGGNGGKSGSGGG